MKKRSDTNKAIANIMKWAERPEWTGELGAVFETHLGPVSERMGISQEALGGEIAELGYDGMVFGLVFEDFLSRRLPPDDRNIIDDYLARRGWRECGTGRRYLQLLRDSVLSLYEVIEVNQGRYCELRDLVRGGKTIRVHEHMGTTNMVKWDRIAGRVLRMDGKYHFSGGLLPFPAETCQGLLELLEKSRKRFNRDLSKMAGKEAADQFQSSLDMDHFFLRSSALAFTTVWLMHTLERHNAPLPEIVNRDGEAMMMAETRFPVAAQQAGEISRRLDAAPGWERDAPEESSWAWDAR